MRAWSWRYRATCPTLYGDWGAVENGGGQQEHATSSMPLESSTLHTGDSGRDVKASGKEGRETPTQRQGPHGESDRAEESEDSNAVHTGSRPHGEGPSPLEVWRTKRRRRTKDPANAHAVHERFCSRGCRRTGMKHG